jgi:hypothetical protein
MILQQKQISNQPTVAHDLTTKTKRHRAKKQMMMVAAWQLRTKHETPLSIIGQCNATTQHHIKSQFHNDRRTQLAGVALPPTTELERRRPRLTSAHSYAQQITEVLQPYYR